ncbi:MAG TPA: hypothetical protein VHO66_01570, partial [Ruminiclostridium sp.]|nr:hypothetical protein [Ruminiclostridium sp.]
ELFLLQCFYNHLLKIPGISLIRYPFWHKNTPFVFSIPYCLTNGVQFIYGELGLIVAFKRRNSGGLQSTAAPIAAMLLNLL